MENEPQEPAPGRQEAEQLGRGGDTRPTETPPPDPAAEAARLRAELEETRARLLASHRRALLAEGGGRLVAELVAGATIQELEASVERAAAAFNAAKAVALADLAASQQPAAANAAPAAPNPEAMSPMEKIAYGLTTKC